jgi:hypothetical protein
LGVPGKTFLFRIYVSKNYVIVLIIIKTKDSPYFGNTYIHDKKIELT